MTPNCKVCNHPEADKINLSLLSGMSNREVLKRYVGDFSEMTLTRHISLHLPEYRTNKEKLREIPVRQAEIRQSMADLDLTQATGTSSADMVLLHKLFASVQRLDTLARETESVKAETALVSAIQAAMAANAKFEFGDDSDP